MEEYKKSTEGQVAGIIGIVMGIISLIAAFIPCVGIVAFVPGGIAIVFSIISIVQANRGNGAKTLGIVSLVISSIAIVIAAAWLMLFSGITTIANKAINNPEQLELLENELRDIFKDLDNQTHEIDETSKTKIDTLESQLRNLESDTAK
ncbi:MAG: hypothetical protein WC951_11180 [Bacteroidales bacterium]